MTTARLWNMTKSEHLYYSFFLRMSRFGRYGAYQEARKLRLAGTTKHLYRLEDDMQYPVIDNGGQVGTSLNATSTEPADIQVVKDR